MNNIRNWFIGNYLAKTDNVFERAKIELIYSFSVFFMVLGLLFYGNLIANHLWYHFYIITFAVVALTAIPFILKYKQNLYMAANWYIVQQIIISTTESIIEEGRLNAIGALFTLSVVLFCFFIYSTRKGFLMSVPFVVLFIISVINAAMDGRLVSFGMPDDQKLPEQPVFTLVPLFLNIYVIWKYVATRTVAEKQIDQQKSLLETKNKETSDSINYAQRIQNAILPSRRLVENHLPGSFIVYQPKDIVSGDFYWIEKKNEKIFFAVADCTGHGVPGAMMSVIGQNALNRVVNEFGITTPSKILDKLSDLIDEAFAKSGSDVRDGMDIALCSLNPVTGSVEYAGAHNPIYHIANGELKEYKASKQPIGRFESRVPFLNNEFKMQKEDSLYLFSDGIADQFGGPDGKKFKYKRVKELLLKIYSKPPAEQKNTVITAFSDWKGSLEQIDDVCLFGVKF